MLIKYAQARLSTHSIIKLELIAIYFSCNPNSKASLLEIFSTPSPSRNSLSSSTSLPTVSLVFTSITKDGWSEKVIDKKDNIQIKIGGVK
jgi:hypothetical protein